MQQIVLLHGVMSSAANLWRSQRDIRDLGWPVTALDLPGHGDRRVTDGSADSVDSMALDVAGRLDQDAAHLVVGHSLGAIVALRLARLRPELVAGVVIEDPPGLASNDPRQVATEVEAAARRARTDPGAEVDSLLARDPARSRRDAEEAVGSRRAFDVDAIAGFLRTQRWDLPTLVADCPAPVQLIAAAGSDSALRGPDRGALLTLIDPALVRIIDSGHSVHRDRPGLWLTTVVTFAASLGPRPSAPAPT